MTRQVSRAEKFSTEKGRVGTLVTVVSIVWTVVLSSQLDTDQVRGITVVAWIAWLLVTLAWAFGPPRWWRFSRRERSIINDELTHEHQRSAALAATASLLGGSLIGALDALGYLSAPA